MNWECGRSAAEFPHEDEPELFVLHLAVAPVKIGNGVVVAEVYVREPALRIQVEVVVRFDAECRCVHVDPGGAKEPIDIVLLI